MCPWRRFRRARPKAVATNDFHHWSQASSQWVAIYEAFLRAQRDYEVASMALREGDPTAKGALVAAAVRLRKAQIELMYFVRHRQPRTRPPTDW